MLTMKCKVSYLGNESYESVCVKWSSVVCFDYVLRVLLCISSVHCYERKSDVIRVVYWELMAQVWVVWT